jgi:predicted lipoprotein with Yx(FWY)xxD motif
LAMNRASAPWPAAAVVLSLLGLAGCTGTSAGRAVTTHRPPSRAALRAPYVVTTRSVNGLGTILVDGKEQTLYLFAPDHDAGRSSCYGLCANQWPPLLLPRGVTKPIAAGDAQAALLGTTRRRNGTIQVTYGGWPLYWFVYDARPGEATGEGLESLGGLWWVLNPSGHEVVAGPRP